MPADAEFDPGEFRNLAAVRMIAWKPFRIKQGQRTGRIHGNILGHPENAPRHIGSIHGERDDSRPGHITGGRNRVDDRLCGWRAVLSLAGQWQDSAKKCEDEFTHGVWKSRLADFQSREATTAV